MLDRPWARSVICWSMMLGGCAWMLASSGKVRALDDVMASPPTQTSGADLDKPPPNLIEPEILTKGPLHEAFATPTPLDTEPRPKIDRQPPPNIEEIPPDQKPEGDNVVWVPGYWSWDLERNDFVWVSGCWRSMPPGRKWVAGYWHQTPEGQYQWVSGFWANQSSDQIEYLPAPPDSLEQGPNVAAPDDEHFWVPGCWVYRESRYFWRPGYWTPWMAGWIWSPSYYLWSPAGYVFVDGFWDYSLRRRGLAFAPCYWGGWSWGLGAWGWRYGWGLSYRPWVGLDAMWLTDSLFCRMGIGGYYFGDFYGLSWWNRGFRPWFGCYGYRLHCPIFTYNQCFYQTRNPQWRAGLRQTYDHRIDNPQARPPGTFREQQRRVADMNRPVPGRMDAPSPRTLPSTPEVARPINRMARPNDPNRDPSLNLQRLDPQRVRDYTNQSRTLQTTMSERRNTENRLAAERLQSLPSGRDGARDVTRGPGRDGPPDSGRPTPQVLRGTAPKTEYVSRPITLPTPQVERSGGAPNISRTAPTPPRSGGGMTVTRTPPPTAAPSTGRTITPNVPNLSRTLPSQPSPPSIGRGVAPDSGRNIQRLPSAGAPSGSAPRSGFQLPPSAGNRLPSGGGLPPSGFNPPRAPSPSPPPRSIQPPSGGSRMPPSGGNIQRGFTPPSGGSRLPPSGGFQQRGGFNPPRGPAPTPPPNRGGSRPGRG